LRLEVKRIQQDLGATMLYVTHDQIEAMTLATRIGVLEHGRIVQLDTPQRIYDEPVSAYVASRLGSPRIALLPLAAIGPHAQRAPRGATQIGVRAEHARLHRGAGPSHAVRALAKRSERLSDQHLLHLVLPGAHELITDARGLLDQGGIEPGTEVGVEIRSELWFDSSGARIPAGTT
jgi:multiple sugar transport system ATP-binding protein